MTAPVKRYNMDVDNFFGKVRAYESEHGRWVKLDDYKRLEQECERLSALLADILAADDGALDELRAIGVEPAPETTELTERIRAALLEKPEETPNVN